MLKRKQEAQDNWFLRMFSSGMPIKEECCFSVLTAERPLDFHADNEAQRDTWLRNLRLVLVHFATFDTQEKATALRLEEARQHRPDGGAPLAPSAAPAPAAGGDSLGLLPVVSLAVSVSTESEDKGEDIKGKLQALRREKSSHVALLRSVGTSSHFSTQSAPKSPDGRASVVAPDLDPQSAEEAGAQGSPVHTRRGSADFNARMVQISHSSAAGRHTGKKQPKPTPRAALEQIKVKMPEASGRLPLPQESAVERRSRVLSSASAPQSSPVPTREGSADLKTMQV